MSVLSDQVFDGFSVLVVEPETFAQKFCELWRIPIKQVTNFDFVSKIFVFVSPMEQSSGVTMIAKI
jgi:hypothetical protein